MADKRVKNFEKKLLQPGSPSELEDAGTPEGNSKMQTPHGELQEVVAAVNELENA